MVAIELFLNKAVATVAATHSAVAAGTVESWVVNSTTPFADYLGQTAGGTPAKQFRVIDNADTQTPPEIMKVINVNVGTNTLTVVRGSEGTTPTNHTGTFTIQAYATSEGLESPWLYDAGLNKFTPTNITESKLAAKVAQVAAGLNQLKLACVGPSTLVYNGSAVIRGWGDWPALLRNIFEANGYTVGEGAVRTNDYLGDDTRITLAGTWTNASGAGATVEYRQSAVAGSTMQLNPTRPFTKVEIEMDAVGPAVTVTVDGVSPLTLTANGVAATMTGTGGSVSTNVFTPSGAANTIAKITIDGLPLGNHLVKISLNASSTAKIYGIDAFPPNSVRVSNFGASGTQITNFLPGGAYNSQLALVRATQPDVCIFDMAFVVNDYNSNTGITYATMKANLISAIQALQSDGIECILIAPLPFQGLSPMPTPVATDPFWQIFVDVANATGCAMLDLFDRWGADYTKPAANGLIGADNFHPNAAGYADVAQAIAAFLRMNQQQPQISVMRGITSPYLKRNGALAATMPVTDVTSNAIAMSGTGIPRAVAIGLSKGDVVKGAVFLSGGTAAVTPTHHWGALVYENGVVLAVSADKTSGAIAANSELVYAFASPWTVLASGLYYLVWCVSATTMPTMSGSPTVLAAMTGPPIFAATAASAATPPSVGTQLALAGVAGMQYGLAAA